MAWPLAWTIIAGTLPGLFAGVVIRVRYLPGPRAFKFFVGLVLLYLASRLLWQALRGSEEGRLLQAKFRAAGGLPAEAVVKTKSIGIRGIQYEFWGETFCFHPVSILALALVVGLIGGIYGIGGGAIIAPFVVAIIGLPVYTVAGAALLGTFVSSVAGVAGFELVGLTRLGAGVAVHPDWALGALFGLGGLFGTYVGARLQRYLPERRIRLLLGILIAGLALSYIGQFFL
jgi:uncharacterized membrane protein YfcA